MPWLNYTDDEVESFHPAFAAAADEALQRLGNQEQLEWIHHLRTVGNAVVPDFVLRRRDTGHWLLAFEVKRRRDSVYSTRNQLQAKGYAETNQDRYRPTAPRYFAISNLEVTLLFALNGDRPPKECQLLSGVFESGDFQTVDAAAHREQFIAELERVVSTVLSPEPPVFELVWPRVLAEYMMYAQEPSVLGGLGLGPAQKQLHRLGEMV